MNYSSKWEVTKFKKKKTKKRVKRKVVSQLFVQIEVAGCRENHVWCGAEEKQVVEPCSGGLANQRRAGWLD